MSKTSVKIIAMVIIFLDVFLWREIFAAGAGGFGTASASVARDYFLDVGQGDGELIIFPGGIKVMTDAGPDDSALAALARILPPDETYLDLAIISHPQLDHFNGFNFILDHYRIGAFIYNGRDDDPPNAAWSALKAKIRQKAIPLITLGGGDRIYIGKGSSSDEIDMLSPNSAFNQSAELNDTGFIELVKTPGFRTLLTADIGFNVENWLLENRADIRADVLKVPHHGSAYSSGDAFLSAVSPRAAVIEVGAKNKYGHPASSTLVRLASDTRALVLRTDQNGTVEIWSEGGKLKVAKEGSANF